MIEIKNIKKRFTKINDKKVKEEFYADEDITFNVNSGEIVGLLGPNGAGKTTLLRIIAGIMKADEGVVLFDGKNIVDNELEIKKSIAFLSGNTKLYKDLSPVELMNLCGEYYQINSSELSERIKYIVNKFDMETFKNQRIGNLSTGQYQRTSIARCLVHNPKYYIFDEATSGLDIISSKDILDFIKEERDNNKGILYSTHYMEEAENICDRVVLINNGKIISIGTPKEIKKQTNTSNLRDAFFVLVSEVKNEK